MYLSAGMLMGLAGKTELAEEMDSPDPDDKHYMKRKADLADRLYRMYDKIEDVELMQRRQYNEIRNDLFFCFRIKD